MKLKTINLCCLYILTLIFSFVGSTCHAQQENPIDQTMVYSLQNANADSALGVLTTAFEGEEGVRMSADLNSNSLVVVGVDETHRKVKKILKVIDKLDPPLAVEVFYLRHTLSKDISRLLNDTLSEEVKKRGLKIVCDARANSLVVAGDKQQFKLITTLVERLDHPQESPSESDAVVKSKVSDCIVRVTWLADCKGLAPEIVEKLKTPPASLNDLIAGLKSDGFEELKMITSCSTRVAISNDKKAETFSNSSLQSIGSSELSFSIKGAVSQRSPKKFGLQISLDMLKPKDKTKVSFSSTFSMPENHPLALSVTNFENLRSAAVIEILDVH